MPPPITTTFFVLRICAAPSGRFSFGAGSRLDPKGVKVQVNGA
jgi:hypothetical protein